MFENDMCLVIYYNFIDALELECRVLTDDEIRRYNEMRVKDYFNCSQDIHKPRTNMIERTETIKLEYSHIKDIIIEPITEKYEKWLDNGDIDFVAPNSETFNTITFIMGNNKSLSICADDAGSNGRTFVWSNEADCNKIIY